jgi:drug/metabolite transporter (DMT)-like permease
MIFTLSKMTTLLLLLVVAYCLSNAFSIALLGDKKLLTNLNSVANVFSLIINWKFILSMTLAILSRILFMLINGTLLKIPYLANSATTITVFITLVSIIFIIVFNHYFLNEALNIRQAIGAIVVLTGVFILLSK